MTITVQPVNVAVGATVHKTPVDQNGTPIPMSANVTVLPVSVSGYPALPAAIATITYDGTGAIFTGVMAGVGGAQWSVKDGADTILSAGFLVTVPSAVTAVGDTIP